MGVGCGRKGRTNKSVVAEAKEVGVRLLSGGGSLRHCSRGDDGRDGVAERFAEVAVGTRGAAGAEYRRVERHAESARHEAADVAGGGAGDGAAGEVARYRGCQLDDADFGPREVAAGG